MSFYVICYALIALQKIHKNENSNNIVLNYIVLLCTRSEVDILFMHILDWINV